jgi:outer membrane protein insertion porin family
MFTRRYTATMLQNDAVRTYSFRRRFQKIVLFLILFPCRSIFVSAQSGAMPSANLFGRVIREIRIVGLSHTREEIILDQLTSRSGNQYTEDAVADDYRWLDRLGLFSSVRISAIPVEDQVALTVELQEFPRVLPYPSINVTGENGISGGFGVKIPSLLRRGFAFSSSARFGPLTETEVLLQSPWSLRRKDWFDMRYTYRDRPNELEHFQEQAHEFELRGGVKFKQNWRVGGQFAWIALKSDQPDITLSRDDLDNIPTLAALLEYDGRDLRSNPHHGWQTMIEIGQNGGWLGGDANYFTARVDVRRYQPLAARHVLAFFSFATLQGGVVGVDVPVYETYHIGGTNSLRGWKPDARHGNSQFLNSLEYRYTAVPPRSFRIHGFGFYIGVELAAFADLSSAWDGGADFTRNMIGGGGFGIRLIIPIVDRIRFDFAFGQPREGILRHFGVREKSDFGRLRVR